MYNKNNNFAKLRLSVLTQDTMQRTNLYSVILCLGLGLASGATEVETSPLSQGDCPVGWIDGSVVGMGCLHFNHTEDMTMLEAAVSCQQGMDNATLVEILTSAVRLASGYDTDID